MTRVGIIANPASGKDIRRLVAYGSTFDNNEKINIVRRILLGLDALGVEQAYYMPDSYAIVPRAADPLSLRLDLLQLPMPVLGRPSDSAEAACRLAALDVGCILTLGGDGTNRVVASNCGAIPLVPISTGTNNVFPQMVEGTLAGLAAGVVTMVGATRTRAVRRFPWLALSIDGELRDHALIDVALSHQTWIGSRALSDPEELSDIVLSRVMAGQIGLCSLGGLLFPSAQPTGQGVHITVGPGGPILLAPVAPGSVCAVPVSTARLLAPGDHVCLPARSGTLALDGEREIELARHDHVIEVALSADGPCVVDIHMAIEEGARHGTFVCDGRGTTRGMEGLPMFPAESVDLKSLLQGE